MNTDKTNYDPTDTLDPGEDFVRLGYFVGTVRKSFWSTPAAETEGKATGDYATKTRLYWSVDVDDVQQDLDEAPENITVQITIGNGWYADESGRHVRHEDAPSDEEIIAAQGRLKPKKFSPSSTYGQYLSNVTGVKNGYRAKEIRILDGGPELQVALKDVGEFLRAHGRTDARDASVWEGFQFQFRGVGFVYDTKDPKPDDELFMNVVPVACTGYPDSSVEPGTAPAASGASSPAADGTGEAPQSPQGFVLAAARAAGADEATLTTLSKLAHAASSHAEFMGNAMLLPAVKDNEAVRAAVATDPGSW